MPIPDLYPTMTFPPSGPGTEFPKALYRPDDLPVVHRVGPEGLEHEQVRHPQPVIVRDADHEASVRADWDRERDLMAQQEAARQAAEDAKAARGRGKGVDQG